MVTKQKSEGKDEFTFTMWNNYEKLVLSYSELQKKAKQVSLAKQLYYTIWRSIAEL